MLVQALDFLTASNTSGLYSTHRRRLGDNLEALAGRCVFSEPLNGQTLGFGAGGPPGAAAVASGMEPDRVNGWRAVVRVLRSTPRFAAGLFSDVVTTIFPADCRCCEGPLERAGLIPVCHVCVDRVRAESLPGCRRCGEALDLDLDMENVRFAAQMASGLLCRECRLAPPAFDRAASFALYRDELRALIQMMKFDRMPAISRLLGGRMAEVMLQFEPAAAGLSPTLVMAVPLFSSRERQRGYNQSVLLAEHGMAHLRKLRPGWALEAAHGRLRRHRRTEAQYMLTRRERRRNLRGAFEVAGDVRGREVLLVDDILTSGATARECARVLKAAGAAKVWVATLARAQKQEFARLHEDPGDLPAGFADVARWEPAPLQV